MNKQNPSAADVLGGSQAAEGPLSPRFHVPRATCLPEAGGVAAVTNARPHLTLVSAQLAQAGPLLPARPVLTRLLQAQNGALFPCERTSQCHVAEWRQIAADRLGAGVLLPGPRPRPLFDVDYLLPNLWSHVARARLTMDREVQS